jgi:hypothetical protein
VKEETTMMTDDHCRPGDLFEYRCPRWGYVTQWRVLSVCLGGLRQESLIEIEPVTNTPGHSTRGTEKSMWVPEPLLRNVPKFRAADNDLA